VLDPERGKAMMGISGGKIIMIEGLVIGEKGTLLTTPEGAKQIHKTGFPCQAIKLHQSLLYA
jgi:hypothetical protein